MNSTISRPFFRHGPHAEAYIRTAFTKTNRARTPFRQHGRRFQSTEAGPEPLSFLKRMWDSPVGLKTVHFWAPVMKWGVAIAGISDFFRPVEKLSVTQNFALTTTGLIWTRWAFIIKPKNYLLASVNFVLGMVGIAQLTRIFIHQQSQKGIEGTIQEVKEEFKDKVGS